jgi:hypothetical protein
MNGDGESRNHHIIPRRNLKRFVSSKKPKDSSWLDFFDKKTTK